MTVWTVGTAIQFVCVLSNGCFILLHFSKYKRSQSKLFLALMAGQALVLLYCGAWMIYDAGKVSGNW